MTFTVTSGAATFVGGINTCSTNASGQCSVQINSNTIGANTIKAAVDAQVSTEVIHRETDSTHGSSGPATKTYVKAKITISPNATNQVDEAHTFTVTVEADNGSGFAPVSGVTVTPAITNSLGATSTITGGTCTDGGTTNASGQYSCTLPYNYTGTVTPTMSGYTFSPGARSYAGVVSSQSGQDYVAVGVISTVDLSGVITQGGSPVSGVVVTSAGGDGAVCTATDVSGRYTCTVPSGWSGSVVPVLSGSGFTPGWRSYGNVTVGQVGQDFRLMAADVAFDGLVGQQLGEVALGHHGSFVFLYGPVEVLDKKRGARRPSPRRERLCGCAPQIPQDRLRLRITRGGVQRDV